MDIKIETTQKKDKDGTDKKTYILDINKWYIVGIVLLVLLFIVLKVL